MKNWRRIPFLFVIMAFLAACTRPSSQLATPTMDIGLVGTIAAMTLEAFPSQTALPSAIPTQGVTPSATITVTVTITPTYTAPELVFTGNTNCRSGPGKDYDVITVIYSGQKSQPVGVSQEGTFWLIKNKGTADCWVSTDFVQTAGSVASLPTVMAPPTPTPVPPNAPAWSTYNFTCDFASGGNNMTMNLNWTDRSNNEEGFIIYRNDQAVVTLGPDTTSYVDTAFVETGKSLSYRVEAFSKAGKASSSAITAACQ